MSTALPNIERLSPEEWNRQWESLTCIDWHSQTLRNFPKPSPAIVEYHRLSEAQTRHMLLTQVKDLCNLQKRLYLCATVSLNYNGLEQRWKALPQEDRKKIALNAIRGACKSVPGLHQHRLSCPELTVANLAGDGEYGFIPMIQRLIPDDLDADLTEPIYIPHPLLDEILLRNDLYGAGKLERHGRNHLITLAVVQLYTELEIGRHANFHLTKPAQKTSENKAEAARLMKELNPETKSETQERKKALATNIELCWTCGLDGATLGQPMKICVKCKAAVGRNTRYCSRECQVEDWKHGKPIPHKQICGKPLDDLNILPAKNEADEVDVDDRFPRPVASFKRSPALLAHILALKSTGSDFVFMRKSWKSGHDLPINCPNARQKLIIMKRRAFHNGDEAAVRAMYDLLVPYANKYNVQLSDLKQQLQKEYNVEVESVATPAPEPTEEEIQIFEKIMKEYPPDDYKVYDPEAGPHALAGLMNIPSASTPQPVVTDMGGGMQTITNHPVFGVGISFG